MENKHDFYNILKITYNHYLPYLQEEKGIFNLIDPIDNEVIGFHYGETHLGSAFIIGGILYNDKNILEAGKKIIKGFLKNGINYSKNPAYHWDFNNFALCFLANYLKNQNIESDLCEKIKSFILLQQDSNNPTINWYPMRIYVNNCKYYWTNDSKYLSIIQFCKKEIEKAQYDDGFFEDLLPKGTSFNFQYHIYTTALLALLSLDNITIGNLEKAVSRFEDIIDPNGDINYLGRGNNQIFAWGPAIFLSSLLENKNTYNRLLNYIYDKGIKCIENNNLIVNDYSGKDKIWWWDYHYSSVYLAHYIFWIILSSITGKKIEYKYTKAITCDSGVHINNDNNYYSVLFDGRNHYLAERGPQIGNITNKKNNITYFKGSFGPFYNNFGYKYLLTLNTYFNFVGMIEQKYKFKSMNYKILEPQKINIYEKDNRLNIEMKYCKKYKGIINIPWFISSKNFKVYVEGREIPLINILNYKGPYGMTYLFQSNEVILNEFKIVIE